MENLFYEYENFLRTNSKETINIGFSDLLGKSIIRIFQVRDEAIVICTSDGFIYFLHNIQDCCESVYIDDICGELENSTGLVVLAEEVTNLDPKLDKSFDSATWTFYKLNTVKDSVTIRFLGESNGYYSESVNFQKFFCPEFQLHLKINNF